MNAKSFLGKTYFLASDADENGLVPCWQLYTMVEATPAGDIHAIEPGEESTLGLDLADLVDMIANSQALQVPPELVAPIASYCRYATGETLRSLGEDMLVSADAGKVEQLCRQHVK